MRHVGVVERKRAGPTGSPIPSPFGILQWVYLGRILVALAVFLSASFYFKDVSPGVLLALAIAALASFVASAASAFYTHVGRRTPGATFIYLQAVFDLALVTVVVHVTGGPDSEFVPLYILVIAVVAVLRPLWSALLVTFLASALLVAATADADDVLVFGAQSIGDQIGRYSCLHKLAKCYRETKEWDGLKKCYRHQLDCQSRPRHGPRARGAPTGGATSPARGAGHPAEHREWGRDDRCGRRPAVRESGRRANLVMRLVRC